jgi:putative SOS response-associated peptidase YedK
MCYHVSFEVKLQSIMDVFPDLVVDPQFQIEFQGAAYINGFDHRMHPAMLTSRKDGKRHLAPMMWGFLPNWVKTMEDAAKMWNGYKDESGKYKPGIITLNAIGEEMFDKPMYKDAALNRRCVIFVDGFYEWHHYFPIGKRGERLKTAVKYPHHIRVLNNPLPFIMMAGIWNPWRHTEVDQETGEIKEVTTPTFAIVTTAANELMAKVHNSKKRMPTILTKELAEEWILDGLTKERILEIAGHQYPAEFMEAYAVRKDFQEVGDPKQRHEFSDWDGVFCD